MAGRDPKRVAVEIFGTTYHVLPGDQDGGHVRKLAAAVDRKMREIAERMSSPEPAKVAILAALNLADELAGARVEQEGERTRIQERAAELAGALGKALGR